jgi:hypothetical protein
MSNVVDVSEAIYEILAAPGGLVHALASDRIYPGHVPGQIDADESIVFFVSSTEDDHQISLESSADRPDKSTVTFICLGGPEGTQGYLRGRRLAKALKKQINGLIVTYGSVEIQDIERVNNEDTFDERVRRFAVVETYEVTASYS